MLLTMKPAISAPKAPKPRIQLRVHLVLPCGLRSENVLIVPAKKAA